MTPADPKSDPAGKPSRDRNSEAEAENRETLELFTRQIDSRTRCARMTPETPPDGDPHTGRNPVPKRSDGK